MENNRWGILYCPKYRANNRKRWQRIEESLRQHGVEYDMVQSESAEGVGRLTRMLIANGYKTIVIAGGDSALSDAVNSLMEITQAERDTIALGVIPNGTINDFARFWGFSDKSIGSTIEHIQQRRVRKIDLGCVRYTDKLGQRQQRYFLNCVNVGMVADVKTVRQQTSKILGSRHLAFIVSLLLMLFHRMSYRMSLVINKESIDRQVMTMCVGSCTGYGLTPNAVPYNGMLDVSLVCTPTILQLFNGLWLLFTGRFLNSGSVQPYRTQQVRVIDGGKARVGIDGHPLGTPQGEYTIDIEQEVVNFIIK